MFSEILQLNRVFKTNEFSKIQLRVYQDHLAFVNRDIYKDRNSKDLPFSNYDNPQVRKANVIELAADELDIIVEQNQIVEVPEILKYFGMDEKYVKEQENVAKKTSGLNPEYEIDFEQEDVNMAKYTSLFFCYQAMRTAEKLILEHDTEKIQKILNTHKP